MGHSGEQAAVPVGARLEAVSGPLKGKVFSLSAGELSIGRDPSNEISLLDSLVSRRHCIIRKEAEAFRLLDLESRNNTFVSGVPIRERVLVPGDQIRVGNSVLVFQGPGGETSTDSPFQLDASPAPGAERGPAAAGRCCPCAWRRSSDPAHGRALRRHRPGDP